MNGYGKDRDERETDEEMERTEEDRNGLEK